MSAMDRHDNIKAAADRLAAIYGNPFGGKASGRYRVAAKVVRQALSLRRLYEDGFFVVMSANSFVNYRRANEDALK
jgi:regulator of replication initiation timing